MRDGRKCRRVPWSDFDLPDEQEKSGMRSVFFVPACAQFLCRAEERAYGPRGAQVMGACRSCLENGLSVSPHPVSGGGLFTAGDSGRYSLNDQPVPPREDAQRDIQRGVRHRGAGGKCTSWTGENHGVPSMAVRTPCIPDRKGSPLHQNAHRRNFFRQHGARNVRWAAVWFGKRFGGPFPRERQDTFLYRPRGNGVRNHVQNIRRAV